MRNYNAVLIGFLPHFIRNYHVDIAYAQNLVRFLRAFVFHVREILLTNTVARFMGSGRKMQLLF